MQGGTRLASVESIIYIEEIPRDISASPRYFVGARYPYNLKAEILEGKGSGRK